ATVRTATMTFAQRILHTLADPNLAYILLILGIYGLIYELANPGFGFGGIGGAISLVIALYSLQILPVNLAGLALVILAFILFIAEAFVVSHGVLGGGGIISLLIGSLVLIDTRAAELRVSLFLILPVVIASVLFSLLIVGAGIRAQRRRVTTGAEGMVGKSGEARTKISRKGQVFVDGELWNASSQQGAIQKGTPVRVVKIDGLKLIVEKI
ncbi:MAG: nodulation protein NfeD, partial [Terriglobia bacterium]